MSTPKEQITPGTFVVNNKGKGINSPVILSKEENILPLSDVSEQVQFHWFIVKNVKQNFILEANFNDLSE